MTWNHKTFLPVLLCHITNLGDAGFDVPAQEVAAGEMLEAKG